MQSSFLLDAKIAYYHTLSKAIQYKRSFLKERIRVQPSKILAREVCA